MQGAIWATAHTTQFAEPGWRYLNNASGQLSPGSYVTLAAPNGHDWSMVVETINGKQPTSMTVAIKGSLGHSTLHVWETNQKRTFEHVGDITPHDGSFTYTFEPDSLYTITTTTGQHKGTAVPPPSKPFPFPYHESFEKTPLLARARPISPIRMAPTRSTPAPAGRADAWSRSSHRSRFPGGHSPIRGHWPVTCTGPTTASARTSAFPPMASPP